MFAKATRPAVPASASAARRFVSRNLADWGLQRFDDVARLLVSELVTNAILPAGTASTLSIHYGDGVVRAEVADTSRAKVAPRTYSQEAGTGRGLLLVQSLAAAWGSSASHGGQAGVVRTNRRRPVPGHRMTEEGVVRVRMLRYPLRVFTRSRAQFEELMREFQLVQIGRSESADAPSVPARLLALVDQFTHQYRDRVESIDAERSAAIETGARSIDMEYDVPLAARGSLSRLVDLLAECDDNCRSDDYLLTLETPPDIVAFREWNIGQILTQLDGGAPTPWPGEL